MTSLGLSIERTDGGEPPRRKGTFRHSTRQIQSDPGLSPSVVTAAGGFERLVAVGCQARPEALLGQRLLPLILAPGDEGLVKPAALMSEVNQLKWQGVEFNTRTIVV